MTPRKKNEIVTEIVLEGTKDQVWGVLTDLESYPAWNPFITRSAGELKAGVILENTMMNGQKAMRFKPLITDLRKDQRFEWLGKAFLGGFRGRHYFELTDTGEGFTTMIQGETFSGWLVPFLLPVIREDTVKGFVAMNKALAARLQTLHGNGTGRRKNS